MKLVSQAGVGTGTAPLTSTQHTGLPWEMGLSEVHETLVLNKLRNRVTLETDGKLLTGRDVAVAVMLGLEKYGFATLPLVLVGCVMIRQCHNNSCAVGIATQDPELRKKFKGRPEYSINYFTMIAKELREIMESLDIRTLKVLVGRRDFIQIRQKEGYPKLNHIDLNRILKDTKQMTYPKKKQVIESSFDEDVLFPMVQSNIKQGKKSKFYFNVRNIHRSVGTYIGSYITNQLGQHVEDDLFTMCLNGSVGQSFGAFIPKGLTLKLEGDTNDYMGKGLSGGKIIVKAPKNAGFEAFNNIITGNVAFYGATSGKAYINGMSGERFGVRNSGATLVVEGTGDHACEYMTGGTVVILGQTGKNIAAGMSGGILYIYNLDQRLLNMEHVGIYDINEKDQNFLKDVIGKHVSQTDSKLGLNILEDLSFKNFTKVIPNEYYKMLFSNDDLSM